VAVEDERARLVARLRERRLWTRERLAEEAGVTTTTVTGVEEARTRVRLGTIEKLAKALEVDPMTLLHPEEVEPPKAPSGPTMLERVRTGLRTGLVAEGFEHDLKALSSEELRDLLKETWGPRETMTLEDLRRGDRIRAEPGHVALTPTLLIRAELLHRGEQPPEEYLPELKKLMEALDLK
jgi:transcriptional regulator with XRE-family HTH domain